MPRASIYVTSASLVVLNVCTAPPRPLLRSCLVQNSSVLENVASIPLPLRLPLGTANGSQLAATGGVSVESNASLLVDGGSVIATNQGMAGNDTNNVLVAGGIYGRGHAKITVTDSTIANNVVNTTKGGAGVLVVDSARLLITGGTAISGNGPATPNGAVGAVVARDNSVVNITGGAVFVANKPKRSALMSNETDIVDMLDFNQFFAARDIVIYPNAALHLDESVQGVNGTGHSVTLDVCGKSVGWIRIPLINECPAGAYPVSMLFCECCLASTYFDGNMTARNCHPCPEGARCRGRWVTPLPGFWHSSPQSGNVHRCLNIAACTGKNCAAGYAGTLCASCAQGWGMTLPFRCVQCNPRWRQLGLYALFSFTTFLFILCTVHFTLRDNRHGGTHVRLSDLIKVVVNFLQYMVILGSVSAPWPDALRQAFVACSVVFGAATGQALSADCWLSHLHLPQPPLAIKRQLLNFLAPVFLACCVAATLAVLCALSGVLQLRRGRTRAAANSGVMRPFTRMLPTIGIIVIFYAYPTLIKASLGFFACFRVDDAIRSHPQGYWVYDMSQRCMDGWHKQWAFGLGLPATIVLCVGVPVGLVWLLLANKGRLDDQAFREKFGFLYRNYTQSKVWWEAVWASQTVLLTAIAVFHYNIKAYHSIVLLSLMFVGSALLQAIAKPYTDLQLHRLHLAASSCLFLTAQCSLTLFNLPGSAMPSDAVAAVEAFMIIINSAFLLWCGVAILMTMAGPAGGAWKWLVGLISARVMCGKAP